jgi:protocatechuate 3,4-dioxygenase beta subunit
MSKFPRRTKNPLPQRKLGGGSVNRTRYCRHENILSGQVLYSNCQPITRALLDFWHADDAGEYDTVGYRLRGHQFTDSKGHYFLETIVPGIYPGRTRHFHVKVKVPNRPILTTQLYFPGERRNRGDRFFMPELLMAVRDRIHTKEATFNFVVA